MLIYQRVLIFFIILKISLFFLKQKYIIIFVNLSVNQKNFKITQV